MANFIQTAWPVLFITLSLVVIVVMVRLNRKIKQKIASMPSSPKPNAAQEASSRLNKIGLAAVLVPVIFFVLVILYFYIVLGTG